MRHISLADADLLISKLLTERIPVAGRFTSSSGAEARIKGFIDSKNTDGTIVVSTSGPPLKTDQGYFRFWITGYQTLIWYGETREIDNEEQRRDAEKLGKSILIIEIAEFAEKAHLIFTID